MSEAQRFPGPTATSREPLEEVLRLDGGRILVRSVGEGPPVLLVNGLGAHTAMWESLENALEGCRVVSFDAPGTGRSSTTLLPVSVPGLARLATQVLDHFGIDRADVLGYSMGGMVVQQLCADFPDRVRRGVLVATSPGVGGLHGDAVALLNIFTPLRYLSPRLYLLTIGQLAGGRARRDPEWIAHHGTLRLRYRPTFRGYYNQIASLTGWSGLPFLDRVHHPMLVIMGDDDPLTPVANGMILAHALPRARLRVISDEGHLLLMDRDSEAFTVIRGFFSADELDEADAWTESEVVSADQLVEALRFANVQLPPWSLLSGCKRSRWLSLGGGR